MPANRETTIPFHAVTPNVLELEVELTGDPLGVACLACESEEPRRAHQHLDMSPAKRDHPPRLQFGRDFDLRVGRAREKLHLLVGNLFRPDDPRSILRAHTVVRPAREPLDPILVFRHPAIDQLALPAQPLPPHRIVGHAPPRPRPILDRRPPRLALGVVHLQLGKLPRRIWLRIRGGRRRQTQTAKYSSYQGKKAHAG